MKTRIWRLANKGQRFSPICCVDFFLYVFDMFHVFVQCTYHLYTQGGGEDVVEEFREACGPADPEVARALYPDTIRALLGAQQASEFSTFVIFHVR